MASSSTTNLATQLEAELICAVCQERFTTPRVLPCQHSFCESCLSMAHLAREHRGRLLPCPTCRAVAVLPDNGIPGFPINFALNNLVQILVSSTEHHEVRRAPPQVFCSLHENRKITMYCCDCHVTTCSKCAGASHGQHHAEIIADVVDGEREALQRVLTDMESALNSSDAELNTANEMLEKITKQTEAAIIKINREADRVLDEVKKKKVGLIGQVNALKTGQTGKISSFKDDLKAWSKKTKVMTVTLQSTLNTVDDVAFLQGASELRGDLSSREKSGSISELTSAEKWIDFKGVTNLTAQMDCLDMGEVKLIKDEPLGIDAILNSRVNTARVSAGRHRRRSTARNSRESDSDSPIQINLERFSQDNAVIIRYTDQRRGRRLQGSAARIRAIQQIGSCGTNLGDFFHPCGMSQLSSGHLVVADQRNNRVQILEENGSFVQMFGNEGSGIREFRSPGDIAVDRDDNIYVLDTRNDRIQVFTADGRFKRIIGGSGSGAGQFSKPQAITIAGTGEIVVADSGNNRIQVLGEDERHNLMFGREGSGEGELMEPCGVAVCGTDVYVCDHHSHRIQIFRLQTGEFKSAFGSFGSEHGQLSYPSSISVAPNGSVIVTEYGNDRLSVFDGYGRFKMCFGDEGNDLGQFLSPNGLSICVSSDGNERNRNVKFYVCDAWNHRLQMLEMIL